MTNAVTGELLGINSTAAKDRSRLGLGGGAAAAAAAATFPSAVSVPDQGSVNFCCQLCKELVLLPRLCGRRRDPCQSPRCQTKDL